MPHTQYVLRDKLTGGAVIVSGYTPPLPLEWFFRSEIKPAFRQIMVLRLINAMRDDEPERFDEPGYELIPIP